MHSTMFNIQSRPSPPHKPVRSVHENNSRRDSKPIGCVLARKYHSLYSRFSQYKHTLCSSSSSRKTTASTPFQHVCVLLSVLSRRFNNFIKLPVRPSLDPKLVLSNNYAPVDELPPTECLITEGKLPACLNGAYIRNGPNPQYPPQEPYHLFDGDGMLHCLHISNGRATLCSRYIKTYRYNVEYDAGCPVLPNIVSGVVSGLPTVISRAAVYAAKLLSGKFDLMNNGFGTSNTSLAYFGGKLFALGESDLPYQIQITPNGDIQTLRRYDFDRKFSSLSRMTAHPKTDVHTGETFAFRCGLISPFLTYFWFDSKGSKLPDVPIFSIMNPTFIHDFAITKKYAIFADIQFGMNINVFELNGLSLVGVSRNKVSRIGVIPRYALDESQMKWFDVPGLNVLHVINAWDEEDGIVIIAPNITPVEHLLENIGLIHASVEKLQIDLRTGTVTRSIMSIKDLEFGVINRNYMGRKNRYGYLGVANPLTETSGVVKLDWRSSEGREVGCRMFKSGCSGGEPFFVPNSEGKGEEDDGYLVTYVHDEKQGNSSFLVMNAKSPNLDIVAEVKLPARVPYGFHGLFVRESELKSN